MKKKFLLILLAVVMTFSCVFVIACNDESPNNNDDSNSEQGGSENGNGGSSNNNDDSNSEQGGSGSGNYVRCDKDGTPNQNGSYILFGEYPQTLKASSVTITSTTDSRGYYLGSDNEYYAKVTADPYGNGYKFSDGSSVARGTVYYFKVEPILWRILSQSNDTAMILCDSIISNKAFDSSSNNYKESDIRAWLNDQFYNTAFTTLEKELVLTTTVDNSVSSTGDSSNRYICENTSDKIFLLSYAEVMNSTYGFSSDNSRQMQTSDYSRATGAYVITNNYYYGNGDWLLRSPGNYTSSDTRYSAHAGFVSYGDEAVDHSYGIVPALQIKI